MERPISVARPTALSTASSAAMRRILIGLPLLASHTDTVTAAPMNTIQTKSAVFSLLNKGRLGVVAGVALADVGVTMATAGVALADVGVAMVTAGVARAAALTGSTNGALVSCAGSLRARTFFTDMFSTATRSGALAFCAATICVVGATDSLLALEISNANALAQHINIHRKVAMHFHE